MIKVQLANDAYSCACARVCVCVCVILRWRDGGNDERVLSDLIH